MVVASGAVTTTVTVVMPMASVRGAEATPEALGSVEAFKRTQPKKSLLQRAKEKAQEFQDKTSVSTKDAMEKAKPALEQAKEKAKEATKSATTPATPAAEPKKP